MLDSGHGIREFLQVFRIRLRTQHLKITTALQDFIPQKSTPNNKVNKKKGNINMPSLKSP